MSRASSAVLRCLISSPPLRAQASAMRRAVAMFPSTEPSGAGQGRSLEVARSPWSSPQVTGVEGASPRGANPMRSWVSRTCRGSFCPLPDGSLRLEPPGPPAMSSSAPRRASGSSAGMRETAMSIRGPSGSAWSRGTRRVAHC